jgi:serine/threonine protein kinase
MLDIYKFFTENVIKKYTRQILEGIEYLHAHNVVHRDLKGANILVDRDGLCKLSDFGGAKVIVDEIEFKQQNSFKGTPNWMAPETVKNMEYTRFSDIWSIGCTVIEMSTGEPPWAEYKNPMATLYNLMHLNTPPSFPPHLTDTCKHFLSCCLKINPKERLNVCKLLRHPFIIGDSPYQYELNPKVSIDDYRKRVEESKINTTGNHTQINTGISTNTGYQTNNQTQRDQFFKKRSSNKDESNINTINMTNMVQQEANSKEINIEINENCNERMDKINGQNQQKKRGSLKDDNNGVNSPKRIGLKLPKRRSKDANKN